MNPELKDRSKKQITKQIRGMSEVRIWEMIKYQKYMRHLLIKFLIKYYMKKIIYWLTLGILISSLIYQVTQIWFGH